MEKEERARMERRKVQGEDEEDDEEVYPRRSLINKKLQHFATLIEAQYGRQQTKVDMTDFENLKQSKCICDMTKQNQS